MRINFTKLTIFITGIILVIAPIISRGQSYSHYNNNGYDPFLRELYKPGNNLHTSVRPLRMDEVNRYISSDSLIQRGLNKPNGKLNIFQRFIHDDLIKWSDSKGPITVCVNPLFNFEMGKETSEGKKTWVNSRGIMLEGQIGKNFSFYADFYENQGAYSGYIDEYIAKRKVVPGQGRVKNFGDNGYDFSQSTGHISYNAGDYFNFQLGFGKNFIGDGYRSLLLSDNTYSYPYFKLTATFLKIKYSVMVSQFQHLDSLLHTDGMELLTRFPTKYGAFHYLTWNIGKRISLGAFESVIWAAEDESGHRGIDMNYLIPNVFYRPIEYGLGSPDNMTIGANLKVILWPDAAFYAQYVMGEFKLDEVMSGDKWWANKQGFQFGLKAYNFLGVENLDVQAEYNQVRPYTYSHYYSINNYGHFNQELAHPLGANFREGISILRYRKGRWHIKMEGMYAIHGKDFDYDVSYGGDIFKDNEDRKKPDPYGNILDAYGHVIGQGLKTNIFNGSGEVSFLINPKNNMNLAMGVHHRKFSNDLDSGSNTNFYFTLRTSLQNFYYDF